MSGILFYVKEPIAAPEENWVQHFDNTEWSATTGSWDGSKWVGNPTGVSLTALGTWVNGYRPTKMRITYANDQSDLMISQVDDSESNTIGGAGGASPSEFVLTFEGFNLNRIDTTCAFGNLTITNIEFLEPVVAEFVPTPTPTAWYDASLIVAGHGAQVQTWDDQIGSADLLQATAANRPLYQAAEQAGKGILKFSEIGVQERYMQELTLGLGSNVWLFCVMRLRSHDGGRSIINGGPPADQYALYAAMTGSSPEISIYRGGSLLANSNVTVGAWHVVTLNYNGASSSFRVDGGNETTADVGSTTGTGFTLGTSAAAPLGLTDQESNIDVAEFIVYNGAVDPTDNEAGLMTKWGVG